MGHLKLGRSSKKKEVGKRRGLAIIYDGFNLVGNRIDIRDFRSRNPLQGRRNRGAQSPLPPPKKNVFMLSKKATKIDEIFYVDLTLCSKCQIDAEYFVNFCGLLRKHEQ